MTEPTTKEEAQKAIDALITQSHKAIDEAMVIADKFGLEFGYEPEYLGTYYGTGSESEDSESHWYPSSWSSSSIYC